MAKKNHKQIDVITKEKGFFSELFNGKFSNYFFIGLIVIILSLSFFKISFQGYAPQASDTMQWRGSAEQTMDYNKNHKDQALWTNRIFSGMPSYLISFPDKYPFIERIKVPISKILGWRIYSLILGGIGLFFYMRHLGFEPSIAFISAMGFALSCHFMGLMQIGHNTKFRAIFFIPWIFFLLDYLYRKRNLIGLGGLSIFLISQLREGHYQISYYTFLLIGLYWMFALYWSIRDKEIAKFSLFTLMLIVAIAISALAVAQPLMSIHEYGEYSIRGGKGGLEKSYSQSWSFHPLEILSFIVPKAFGEVSPLYWGWMPFTQTSMYMGIFILLLAITALIFVRNRYIAFLTTASVLTLLFSFGRHFDSLSVFLRNYLPFFNKFRVPATILVLLQFIIVILAGYGLKFIIKASKNRDQRLQKYSKIGVIISVVMLLFFLFGSTSFTGKNMVKDNEVSKYKPAQLDQLKEMRAEALVLDGVKTSIFIGIFFLLTLSINSGKLNKFSYIFLIATLSIFDLMIIDKPFTEDFVEKEVLENYHNKTKMDSYLLKDKEEFRIYPLASEFSKNKWCFYHQSIGGYHAAKMARYRDVLDNCLNKEIQSQVPINWNIVNMLNVKYLIFNQRLPLPELEFAYHDDKQKMNAYKNISYLPRAWFVKDKIVLSEKNDILKKLNSKDFTPKYSVILENDVPEFSYPDTNSVKVINSDVHYISFEVQNNKDGFLVVSEIYYPAGWNAYLDEKKIKINPANYILRGVNIPKGKHLLEMKFEPEIYSLSVKLSLTGILLSIFITILGIFIYYRKNYSGKTEDIIE